MPVLFRSTGTLSGPGFALRPRGGLARVAVPIACAVIERPNGLLLIDTGWSRAQCAWPAKDPGWFTTTVLGVDVRPEQALASQLISLEYDPKDVRDVIATHLHTDHVGGAVDFPAARIHTTPAEWHARQRGLRGGYAGGPLPFADRLALHELTGPAALGFAHSHDLFGDGSVLLLGAPGRTHGGLAVAVKLAEGWLVHAGDAVLEREELTDSARGASLAARAFAADNAALTRTRASLRDAERAHGARVVPSHDAAVFSALPSAKPDAWRAAWDPAPKAKKEKEPAKPKAKEQKAPAAAPVVNGKSEVTSS